MVVFRAAALMPVKDLGRGAETGSEQVLLTLGQAMRPYRHSPKVTPAPSPSAVGQHSAPRGGRGGCSPSQLRGSLCETVKEHPGVPWRRDGATAH